MKTKFEETGSNKSKVLYHYDGKDDWTIGKREEYMNKLTRNQVSTIVHARGRMTGMKSNYKNGNINLICRLCGKSEETHKHVLEECQIINQTEPRVTKEMVFSKETKSLKTAAKNIERRMEKLLNQTSTCL